PGCCCSPGAKNDYISYEILIACPRYRRATTRDSPYRIAQFLIGFTEFGFGITSNYTFGRSQDFVEDFALDNAHIIAQRPT
ncbi:MAG: hypothetical protein AAFU84_06055, partial [Cyanobacteria bacterium J06633_23]